VEKLIDFQFIGNQKDLIEPAISTTKKQWAGLLAQDKILIEDIGM
jgi:hypothetical protein